MRGCEIGRLTVFDHDSCRVADHDKDQLYDQLADHF